MKTWVPTRLIVALLVCMGVLFNCAEAQLNTLFSDMFHTILSPSSLKLAGKNGAHASHFLPADSAANEQLVPALNSLIGSNIGAFPLSSTGAGVIYEASAALDPLTGLPLKSSTSLGPIFGENARSLGAGKIALYVSYTFLDLVSFRGLPVDQMQFAFTHENVSGKPYLGSNPNESDVITITPDLHTNVHLGALYATVGLAKNLDVGVALPVVDITMNGTARAVISSYSFSVLGHANHFFGGDSLHPRLDTTYVYNRSAAGIGDLAVRAKYSFPLGGALDAAALLDVRLPTGRTDDFMGTGKTTLRIWGILSRPFGDLTPHLNVGYTHNPAEFQSDRLEFRAGFDNRIYSTLTFALDILGQIDLNPSKTVVLGRGSTTIYDHPAILDTTKPPPPDVVAPRVVPNSNVPDSYTDNIYDASFGFRFAPSDRIVLFFNMIVPMNNKGLRASLAPTLGFSAAL